MLMAMEGSVRPSAAAAAAFQCLMCGRPAESHLANVRHMMTHLRSYLCMVCGEEFTRGPDLVQHAEEHEDGAEARRPRVVVVDLTDESAEDGDGGGGDERDSEDHEDIVRRLEARGVVSVISIDLTSDDDRAEQAEQRASPEGSPGPRETQERSSPSPHSTDGLSSHYDDVSEEADPFYVFLQKRAASLTAAASVEGRGRVDVDVDGPLIVEEPAEARLNVDFPVNLDADSPQPQRPQCASCSRPGPASRKRACCGKPVEKAKRRGRKKFRLTARPKWSSARMARSEGDAQGDLGDLQAATPGANVGGPAAFSLSSPVDEPRVPQPGAPRLRSVEASPEDRTPTAGPRPQKIRKKLGRPPSAKKAKSAGAGGPLSRVSCSPVPTPTSATPSGVASNAAPSPAATPLPKRWIDDIVAQNSTCTLDGLKCGICTSFLKSKTTHWHLLRHLRKNPNTTCVDCGEEFGDKVSLMTHKVVHLFQNNYFSPANRLNHH